MIAVVSVRGYGQGPLFMESHPNTVEWKCLTAARGVMKILPGVRFYIYIENLLAKAVSLPKHMTLTLANDAPHTSYLPEAMNPTHQTSPLGQHDTFEPRVGGKIMQGRQCNETL